MQVQIKKYIVSVIVVAAFVAYAVFERNLRQSEDSVNGQSSDKSNPAVSGVKSNTQNITPSATATPSLSETSLASPSPPPPTTPPPAKKPTITSGANTQIYKDRNFVGSVIDAYYGKVQVRISMRAGKIIDSVAINYPQDNQTSVLINNQAIPALKSETLKAQSANIDTVSGATYTSYAYATSLDSALSKARNTASAKPNTAITTPKRSALTPPPANPTPAPAASITPPPAITPTTPVTNGAYADGQYTGDLVNVYYGNVQVQASILNGKISDVQFLSYPQDRQTSVIINSQATPMLRSEALAAQSANVNIVSGATYTSTGFIQSLASALKRASTGSTAQPSTQPQTPQSVPVKLPLPSVDDDEFEDD